MSASRVEELGQFLFVKLEDDRWSSALEKRLKAIHPGGILLKQENLRTPETALELLRKIVRALDAPTFIALEGAVEAVSPLQQFFSPLPPGHVVEAVGPRAIRRAGELAGKALNLLGFNTHLAPLLDFATDLGDVPAQFARFDRDGERVADYGEDFIQGLQHNGVLACPGSFPGFGDARRDSDSGRWTSSKPMARMWREDLVPFRRLLTRIELVMVSNLTYKAYDLNSAIPACLSTNVLEGLLRVKLNYRGAAVADLSELLEGESVDLDTFSKSIAAGCDIVVPGFGVGSAGTAAESLKKAADLRMPSTQRIAEGLKRISRVKKGLRLPTGKFSRKAFDRLCREFEDFNKECRSAEREIV